jgi:hypothetical protein
MNGQPKICLLSGPTSATSLAPRPPGKTCVQVTTQLAERRSSHAVCAEIAQGDREHATGTSMHAALARRSNPASSRRRRRSQCRYRTNCSRPNDCAGPMVERPPTRRLGRTPWSRACRWPRLTGEWLVDSRISGCLGASRRWGSGGSHAWPFGPHRSWPAWIAWSRLWAARAGPWWRPGRRSSPLLPRARRALRPWSRPGPCGRWSPVSMLQFAEPSRRELRMPPAGT